LSLVVLCCLMLRGQLVAGGNVYQEGEGGELLKKWW